MSNAESEPEAPAASEPASPRKRRTNAPQLLRRKLRLKRPAEADGDTPPELSGEGAEEMPEGVAPRRSTSWRGVSASWKRCCGSSSCR
jgi:hypothetical protein